MNPIENSLNDKIAEFSKDLSAIQTKRFEEAPICIGKYLTSPIRCIDLLENDPAFVQEMINDVGYSLFSHRLQSYLRTESGARFRDKFRFPETVIPGPINTGKGTER